MATIQRAFNRRLRRRALTVIALFLLGACQATQGLWATETNPTPSAVDSVRVQVKARQLDAAEARAQVLLAAAEAAAKERPLELVDVLDVLVEIRIARGEGARPATRELAERAVAVAEAAAGADGTRTSTELQRLANVVMLGGDLPGSRALYEKALKIREQRLGPDHPDVATTLGNLAFVIESAGDLDAAQALYERALRIMEQSRGPRHPDVASALADLAGLWSSKGDNARAQPILERALAIREEALGPTDPDVINNLTALGILMREMGDYPAARQYFERAVHAREQALGPEHPAVASNINNLASLLAESGDFAAARPLFERALAIRTRALGPEHRDVGTSVVNLANVLLQTGDYAAAKPLFERALAIYEKALGPEHRNVALCLDNMAALSVHEGDLATARTHYARSLAIKEKALGPEHPSVAVTMDALGKALLAQGDVAGAHAQYERALAIKEKTLGPEHPEIARGLDNLGTTLYLSGEYARALPLHEQALALREKSLGAQHPDVALSLRNCAFGELATGNAEGAFGSALRAEQVGSEHLRLTSRSLGEREALQYAAVRYGGLDLALTLLVDPRVSSSSGMTERAWDTVVHSRAIVLDEMATRHRGAFESGDSGTDSLAAAVQAARGELANLIVRGVGNDDPEAYRHALEALTATKEAAERRLADHSAGFQAERARAEIGLADVMAALPAGAALVAYSRFTPPTIPEGATGGAGLMRDAAYVAFVGSHGAAGRMQITAVPLGGAAAIDSLAGAWRREAGEYVWGDRAGAHEAVCRQVGEALRRRIWDPLATDLDGADLVLVVPDGPLHLVNLAALPVGEAGYLVEERLLHVLSAERDVVRPPGGSGEGLLAVGDPDYDRTDRTEGSAVSTVSSVLAMLTTFRGARPGCAAFDELTFSRLPSTRQEIGDVDRLWKRAHRREPRVELTGRRASEARVKAEMRGKRVVHLATHGFFLGDACVPAAAGVRERRADAAVQAETPLATASLANPLLLAGLALAGSNQRHEAAPDAEDGVLTAEEVASLDLRGVEWAVLSACETAAGDVHADEGVFGLRRAFETAGAHTLIMSLWSVEDEAGRAWMDELYRARLTDGLPTAEAVRQADRRILDELRRKHQTTHPSLWAGFIAAGDWR